mmetsp:Transcript_127446/g.231724  ORF Transcript_127446/g.231724 Transcript_127446/m.231724 type:complete len:288 (+) Transcript_127446:668-1531(+)
MQTLSTHKPSSCKCFSEALVPLHNVKPSQEACRGLAEKFLILGSEGHTLILWQREQRLSKTTGRVHAQELEVCHSINATRRSRISERSWNSAYLVPQAQVAQRLPMHAPPEGIPSLCLPMHLQKLHVRRDCLLLRGEERREELFGNSAENVVLAHHIDLGYRIADETHWVAFVVANLLVSEVLVRPNGANSKQTHAPPASATLTPHVAFPARTMPLLQTRRDALLLWAIGVVHLVECVFRDFAACCLHRRKMLHIPVRRLDPIGTTVLIGTLRVSSHKLVESCSHLH